ncbi:hypothetical protein EW145_g6998 [Phellinidium pouzarii]|uniref:Uncharacterized protein n=1 Tax=Phellinidium pouzarii TaxID=167371 RepID=A0A4S4KRP3_9AGAM|nr:hypothetical protein EW145_g6998 [Phellinidium pouzarii]
MPRPEPLQSTSTAYSASHDYQALTPRTPFSRAGRAEEARHGLEINTADDEYVFDAVHGGSPYATSSQQQQEPLLASSASASFPLDRLRPYAADPDTLHSYLHANISEVSDELEGPTPTMSQMPITTAMSMTLSYASYTSFPLEPTQYSAECASFLASMKGPMGTYWYIPPGGPLDVPHPDESVSDSKICKSSITYMLDGFVGLAADLALMAQAAGLAREVRNFMCFILRFLQNRTFFVNDQFWNRGKWTDYFEDVSILQPGPEPGCLPPPPEELVACPRTARHWIVGSRTAVFHFGHGFADEFENPYARELRRLKPIFSRAADSLVHTIVPNAETAALITSARREVTAAGPYIAVHVRRGDRRAEAWAFHGGYVPLGDFVKAVRETAVRLFAPEASDVRTAPDVLAAPDAPIAPYVPDAPDVPYVPTAPVAPYAPTAPDVSPLPPVVAPNVFIASDDPAIGIEFAKLISENTTVAETDVGIDNMRIFSLVTSADEELKGLASNAPYVQHEFNVLSAEERVRATRGAIVDFALVSGLWAQDAADDKGESEAQPEAVVCTIGSNFCKLAAVGLGWERAFGFEAGDPDTTVMAMDDARKRWVEIDNAGSIVPVWRAFEMF